MSFLSVQIFLVRTEPQSKRQMSGLCWPQAVPSFYIHFPLVQVHLRVQVSNISLWGEYKSECMCLCVCQSVCV